MSSLQGLDALQVIGQAVVRERVLLFLDPFGQLVTGRLEHLDAETKAGQTNHKGLSSCLEKCLSFQVNL